ncbi:MAG: PH domain-containing protein [Flavobacteriales bacterium]|nr:PH domain-containing protein [Flavobacteriales bacterium]
MSGLLAIIIMFMVGVTIYLFVAEPMRGEVIAAAVINILAILLISGFYFNTYYTLNNEYLFYKSGIMKGKIKLENITEIEVGKTVWVGIKPATAGKGLRVKYKFGEIYISPKTNETFVQAISVFLPSLKIIHS